MNQSCHKTRPDAKLFVTTRYWVDAAGRIRADITDHCPRGADGSGCRIRVHHIRDRKTGPEHGLLVVGCRTHERYFTLYPWGYVPYGRRRVAPVDETGNIQGGWEGTLFAAARDAADGKKAWSRESDYTPGWRTQRRHIERAATMLGILCSEQEAEQAADALGVGLAIHRSACEAYRQAEGFRGRGRAVASVLQAVTMDSRVLIRILRSGATARLWSEPWLWQAGSWRSFPLRE